MKKIILLICFLFTSNAWAQNPFTKDVDTFYKACENYMSTAADFNSGVCLGYTDASLSSMFFLRFLKTHEDSKCKIKTGELLDRFLVLYRRNQIEIGTTVFVGMMQSFDSLCPENK